MGILLDEAGRNRVKGCVLQSGEKQEWKIVRTVLKNSIKKDLHAQALNLKNVKVFVILLINPLPDNQLPLWKQP